MIFPKWYRYVFFRLYTMFARRERKRLSYSPEERAIGIMWLILVINGLFLLYLADILFSDGSARVGTIPLIVVSLIVLVPHVTQLATDEAVRSIRREFEGTKRTVAQDVAMTLYLFSAPGLMVLVLAMVATS